MIMGGSKCALAGEGPCRGKLEWDHVYPKSRLKREFKYGAFLNSTTNRWEPIERTVPVAPWEQRRTLDDIIGDTRNRRWLCTDHHELVTKHARQAPIPDSVWDFCKDYGLTAQLENDIARAA